MTDTDKLKAVKVVIEKWQSVADQYGLIEEHILNQCLKELKETMGDE